MRPSLAINCCEQLFAGKIVLATYQLLCKSIMAELLLLTMLAGPTSKYLTKLNIDVQMLYTLGQTDRL